MKTQTKINLIGRTQQHTIQFQINTHTQATNTQQQKKGIHAAFVLTQNMLWYFFHWKTFIFGKIHLLSFCFYKN